MASASWMRAFEMQMDLWLHAEKVDVGAFVRRKNANTEQQVFLEQAIQAISKMLFLADPIFVSADMSKVVETAAATFTPEPFEHSDLLTPCGFVMFDELVEVWTGLPGDQARVPYTALAWIGVKQSLEADAPMGISFVTFAGGEFMPPDGVPEAWDIHFTQFGEGVKDNDPGPWKLIQTTLRLMAEFRAASRYSTRPTRGSRRRAARVRFPERDVTVVRLRRERAINEHLGGSANYSVRFMVSGHWRNQWCPSLKRHRQTWIAPYVKGPTDKPFKPTRGRAFTLTR